MHVLNNNVFTLKIVGDTPQCLDYVVFLQRTLTSDLPVRAKSLADGRGSVFVHVALLLLFLEFTQ